MATLTWEASGSKIFQTGIDRGVLYLQSGEAIPWNGLTGIEDSSAGELKSYYLDGFKFLETLTPRDFVGKLTAFTYPDEFEECLGNATVVEGLTAYEQPPKSFNLSYRTRIGNDIDGEAHGYKIHIFYNLLANPDSFAFKTIDSNVAPIEFSWALTGTPPKVDRFRPMVHVTVDSLKTPADILQLIEAQMYGTATQTPTLPTFQQLQEYFHYVGALVIIDNGDGTWTAIDQGGGYIIMLDDTTFKIENADANMLDANTYTLSSTNVV